MVGRYYRGHLIGVRCGAPGFEGGPYGTEIRRRRDCFSLAHFGSTSTLNAQCKDGIVGTWKLVSVAATTNKGDVDEAVLGQNPSGLLTHTLDGGCEMREH